MATRDDLLGELGLLPRWQLRSGFPAAVAPPASAAALAVEAPGMDDTATARAAPPGEPAADARAARIAALGWDALPAEIAACSACGLCRTRHKTVPGVGDARAEWLFVGEAPGAEEDARGEPFVGQAGRLLDNMLAALGLARTRNVYIANVLKSRPPGNRDPLPDEVAACLPYLERQIDLIRPRIILALGRFAAQSLLLTDTPIGRLRGQVHAYRGVPLVVTYHPAYLLRNPADKAKVWEDLVLARRTLAGMVQQ